MKPYLVLHTASRTSSWPAGHPAPTSRAAGVDRPAARDAGAADDVARLSAAVFDGRRERALMLAVLLDAVGILRRPLRVRRALYEEAYGWIFSDDVLWPFSFLNICEALDLDAERLRRRLAAAPAAPPSAAVEVRACANHARAASH